MSFIIKNKKLILIILGSIIALGGISLVSYKYFYKMFSNKKDTKIEENSTIFNNSTVENLTTVDTIEFENATEVINGYVDNSSTNNRTIQKIVTNSTNKTKIYKVYIDLNNGEGYYENTIGEGYKFSDFWPVTLTDIEGYTFVGWYEGDKPYDINAEITSDIWVRAKYEISYVNISFDANGGTNIPDQKIQKSLGKVKVSDPVRDGYLFLGWKNDDQKNLLKSSDIDGQSYISDDKYTAMWSKIINMNLCEYYACPLNSENYYKITAWKDIGTNTYSFEMILKSSNLNSKVCLLNYNNIYDSCYREACDIVTLDVDKNPSVGIYEIEIEDYYRIRMINEKTGEDVVSQLFKMTDYFRNN